MIRQTIPKGELRVRKIETVMGEGCVDGIGTNTLEPLDGAGSVRALVKNWADSSLSEPAAAADLAVIFARFAPPGYRLRFAESATYPTGMYREFKLSKNTWNFFADIMVGDDVIGEICREVKLKDRTVRHWHFDLGEHSGNGLGPAFLASSQALYEEIGIRSIQLSAGGPVGAVLWARTGFRFTGVQKSSVESVYDAWQSASGHTFPNRNGADWDACDYVDIGKGGDLHTVKEVFREIDEGLRSLSDDAFELVWAQRYPDTNVHHNNVDIAKKRPLGECIMHLIAEWDGILDFADPTAMNSFRQFLAKGAKHLA